MPRVPRRMCRALPLAAAAVLAVAWSGPAWPANDDTLQISARYQLLHDSNVLRVSSLNRQPVGGSSTRSDTIGMTTLGVLLDKSYSLQRFEVDANLVDRRYRNFDYLSFTTLDYRAAWHWSATPRVRGLLLADHRRRSNSYSDVSNVAARNLRTDDILRLDGEADLGAAVRLIGSVGQVRTSNEQAVLDDRDERTRSVAAGVRYVYPSGSSVSYRLRRAQGEYLNRERDASLLPTRFDQTEHEISAGWSLTSKTSVSGQLSYLRRTHPGVPQRDFSAPLGEVRMRWAPTGKLRLDAGVARTYRVSHTDYASYALGRRIMLIPTWDATAHTSLRLQLEHWDQDYGGRLPSAPHATDRNDITRLARLALDWRPRESILLTLLLQTERRSSSYNGFDYRTHGAGVSARVQF